MKRKSYLFLIGTFALGSCFSGIENVDTYNTAITVYADEDSSKDIDMSKLLDMDEMYGWAAAPGEGLPTTTGGGEMAPVVVSTMTEFRVAVEDNFPRVIVVDGVIDTGDKVVSIGSNKTIVGIDDKAEIHGGIHVYNSSNVIISNLNFNGGWPNAGPDDCIDVAGSHHLWFNHLNIYNSYDGNLDIKQGADYITVSWCKFSYTDDAVDGVAPDHDHRLSCLIGSGAGDHDDTDMGRLRVSYHHNWFASNLDQRMPRVMYGRAHIYNNYYSCRSNSYCIGVDSYAAALIENNYFDNVNTPHKFMYPTNALPAAITARGNEYDNSPGNKDSGQKKPDNNVSEFKNTVYDYLLNDAKDVPELITVYSGPKNDISDKSIFSDKITNATLVEGVDDSYIPPENLPPVPTLEPVNSSNTNPVTYDEDNDTYTYHGQGSQGKPSYYNIENPFKGKDFAEDYYNYYIEGKWQKGVTVSYWVNVPETARDAAILSFNLENDRQIERKDAVKYNTCREYSKDDYRYAMGEIKTYVDVADNEYKVLEGDIGYLVQYNPNYPKEGCYRKSEGGGAICVHEKGADISDESNWFYLDYLGEGYYENYGKRFDEEGGENSKISEAYISGSFCLYASGSMGFKQDNGEALQINPNLETYGNKIDIQTTNQFYYWGSGGYQSQAGSTFVVPTMAKKGKWHFVVAVIQNDWVQFYMDGKEIGEQYLTSWGAALADKETVSGPSFNYGFGYRLRPTFYLHSDTAMTATTILDFISNEKTELTVGGMGAAANILGQSNIKTPDGTMVKELTFYDEPVKSYCIMKDKIDLDATPNTPTPKPTSTAKPTSTVKPTITPTATPEIILGDADGNKKVEIADVTLALKIALKLAQTPTGDSFNVIDVDSSGDITLDDVVIILKIALKIK